MHRAVIVTGATGFLGSHLVTGILGADTDLTVVCLARPQAGCAAEERVVQAVRRAYRDQTGHDEPAGWAERVVVIEQDLCSESCRSEAISRVARLALQVDAFWHCAASVELTGQRGGAVWRANVDGLRNALAIAERLGAPVFNHVSTAYVGGKRTGRISERLDLSPRGYNNIYEESKHIGEHMVDTRCRASKMAYRIFRPSLVIGHSRTHRNAGATGLYEAVNRFDGFARAMRARSPGYFRSRTLKVQIDREGTLNLIPIDIVIAEMLDLAALGSRTLGQVFHITSESPVSVHDTFQIILEQVGIERFEVAVQGTVLSSADRMFESSLKSYAPYFSQRKIFERNHVVRHGADRQQIGYLMDLDRLRRFISHHLASRQKVPFEGEVGAVAPGLGAGNVLIPEVMIA